MSPVPSLLLIEDDDAIRTALELSLTRQGHRVATAASGEDGLKLLREQRPDLIVLDVMLPGIDGVEVLARLRRESDVYVILLTAKTEETDKIIGLSVGADDYVTKPFSPRELVARIKAALRRMKSEGETRTGNILQYKHIRIDTGSRQVWVDDRPVELTQTEFDLLAALAEHRGMVLSREQLLEKVWGYDYFGDLRVVDVHVGHLRQKLGSEPLVATVRGVGYRFEDVVE